MTKTYEILDDVDEGDDEMVEFDPQVVENLNWWQRCFVPKYPGYPCNDGEDASPGSVSSTPSQRKGEIEECIKDSRDRFNSEDVTVSTNLTTPPGTPDINYARSAASTQKRSNRGNGDSAINTFTPSDVENPSIRNGISAIDEEECEDAEKSSEDDKNQKEVEAFNQ